MEEVVVFHDIAGHTPSVWFGRPQDECVCEEAREEVILMKNRPGRVIGFEKLNFHGPAGGRLAVSLQTIGGK